MRKRIYENKNIPKENKGLYIILFIFTLILSWLIFFIPLLPPIIFLFWLVVLITLWKKNTNLKWYLLCFSGWTIIPILSFSMGFVSYFTGNAAFDGHGLTGPESYNLEPERRLWYSNSGCMVNGSEFLSEGPNNFIVILMNDLFGVQNGVYKGIYPDKNETKKILDRNGKKVSFSKPTLSDKNGNIVNFRQAPLSFSFVLKDKEFSIKGEKIKNDRYPQYLIDCDIANVALANDELIIFKPIILDNQDKIVTYLADSKTGIIFARYYE